MPSGPNTSPRPLATASWTESSDAVVIGPRAVCAGNRAFLTGQAIPRGTVRSAKLVVFLNPPAFGADNTVTMLRCEKGSEPRKAHKETEHGDSKLV
jgi:hypothetical protein